MTQHAPKDFFISYNRADRSWAEWIAWQLETHGYRTIVQAWDFRPGSNFALQMQHAASAATHTLAVLSSDYLTSLYTQPEWAAAFVQDPTGLLAAIVHIDLVGLNESEATATLLAGVQSTRAKPATAPTFPGTISPQADSVPSFPGTLPTIWNIPYRRNPFFTGREPVFEQLHHLLHAGKTTDLTQPQAISGLGGIGKTQVAIEYAYRYREDYKTVLWVNARTREELIADIVTISERLNLPEKNAQNQNTIVTAVKLWLEMHTGWLLILDNADDLTTARPYLQLGDKGHILLTTRTQD